MINDSYLHDVSRDLSCHVCAKNPSVRAVQGESLLKQKRNEQIRLIVSSYNSF